MDVKRTLKVFFLLSVVLLLPTTSLCLKMQITYWHLSPRPWQITVIFPRDSLHCIWCEISLRLKPPRIFFFTSVPSKIISIKWNYQYHFVHTLLEPYRTMLTLRWVATSWRDHCCMQCLQMVRMHPKIVKPLSIDDAPPGWRAHNRIMNTAKRWRRGSLSLIALD
jgi:hypothetical protein